MFIVDQYFHNTRQKAILVRKGIEISYYSIYKYCSVYIDNLRQSFTILIKRTKFDTNQPNALLNSKRLLSLNLNLSEHKSVLQCNAKRKNHLY